jgi:hypothetical protein
VQVLKYWHSLGILIFTLFTALVRGQEYAWPTEASQLITSTFGEYRPGHIHAGIDIKTWGQEGFPVVAIDDGSIIRIRVSPYGYGRVVYHLLNNGMTAVYAHLSRFNDRIEQIVKKEQKRYGRFAVQKQFASGTLILKKGDLIGYTGSSGAEAAHLHFEIWNQEDHPLNPFHLGYEIQDTIPPQCQAMAATPLQFGSHVEGDFLPHIYPLKRLNKNEFVLEKEIRAWGSFGLALSAYDQADGASNRFHLYHIQFFVNEQPIFSVKNDCFPVHLTQQIELDRDYRLQKWDLGLFQKLYVDQGNHLPFYNPSGEGAGVLSCWGQVIQKTDSHIFSSKHSEVIDVPVKLESGEHTLRIEAEDYFGNRSTIHGKLCMVPLSMLVSDLPFPEMDRMEIKSETIEVPKVLIEKRFLGDYIRFRILSEKPLISMPELYIRMHGSVRNLVSPIPMNAGEFIGSIPLDRGTEGELVAEFQFMTQPGFVQSAADTFEIFSITPEKGGKMVSSDGLCKITFPDGSVYQPFWGTIQTSTVPLSMSSTRRIYHIVPDDVPLKKKIDIQLNISPELNHHEKMGIYGFNEKSENVYLESHWRDNISLTAKTEALTAVVVLMDTLPPVIQEISPISGSVVESATPKIMVYFKDQFSGIYGEDNYVIRLDGKRQIAEYEPEKQRAFHRVDEALSHGKHVAEFVLKDRAGNITVTQSTFYVSLLE